MEGSRWETSSCVYYRHWFVSMKSRSKWRIDSFPLAAFLGAITIPLSLVLLGASFARMKIPRPISRLPIAAILFVCVAKLVLLPIIGVFIVQAMVRGGLIPRQNKVQIFAAMYLSGTPTSITYEPNPTVDLRGYLTTRYIGN